MPADAVVIVDGAGGGHSLKEAKFADLSVGGAATAGLHTHQSFAMLVKVEGPTSGGLIKAEDAEKRTATLAFLSYRVDNPEEATYVLAMNSR